MKAANGAPLAFLEEAILRETDECILWPFGKTGGGYGVVHLPNAVYVHIEVARRVYGDFSPGLVVAHSCGNNSCINHHHLRWTTQSDNMMDCADHGTSIRGRSNGTRLSENHIHWIRRQIDIGVKQKIVADYLGMSPQAVNAISKYRSWRWLPKQEPYTRIWSDLE